MDRYSKTRLRTGKATKGEAPAEHPKPSARTVKKTATPSPEDILSGDSQLELPLGQADKKRRG